MSKLTDFVSGAVPYLDLKHAAPSIDLTPVTGGLNAQKGDKSSILFAAYGSAVTLYNNAGSLVWTKAPSGIEGTMTNIIAPGHYIPATNTLHIVAYKNTSTYDLVYCTINTLNGVVTAGTKQASLVASPQPLESADLGNSVYYMSGGTLYLFHQIPNSVGVVLSMNVSTKVITNVSATNQVPTGKVILTHRLAAYGAVNPFVFLSNSTIPGHAVNIDQLDPLENATAAGYIPFGDYMFPRKTNFALTAQTLYHGYTKAQFYAAWNRILPAVFPGKTILEV